MGYLQINNVTDNQSKRAILKFNIIISEDEATKKEWAIINALSKAIEAGNSKAVNVVLIGILASQMDIAKETWIKVIENTVPPKFFEVNKIAFEAGYNYKG